MKFCFVEDNNETVISHDSKLTQLRQNEAYINTVYAVDFSKHPSPDSQVNLAGIKFCNLHKSSFSQKPKN